ncbi:2-oxoisovalerate dehydrogenase E1 alpha subunit N terminal (plasmid) [Hoeflea sp. IMCC20628]|uniref:hypothetical protein n=1 Tax=Hoeflea sp. IMCC20628 TaxID=1620421 RepID=UPI00063BED20|nr:hypothetical protein [Hoeflea sp. IMCC20628]AKI03446.1 2-oxoisovalerate dehydrogenase E1 alpha subunit N terminal [Hoeflea sp. IMCC20628]
MTDTKPLSLRVPEPGCRPGDVPDFGSVAGIVLSLILRLLLPIQDAEHAAQIQC